MKKDTVTIGKIYQSTKCGKFEILEKIPKETLGIKQDKFKIRFLTTGSEFIIGRSTVNSGLIKDPKSKNIYNVACCGNTKPKEHWQIYIVWFNMIQRCYNKNNPSYKSYGAEGIKICDEWLNFEFFLKDYKKIDGWNEYLFNNKKLNLDKDKKTFYSTHKKCFLYSKENCTWLLKEENYQIQPSQQFFFEAISKEGETYTSHNITNFARQHNLSQSKISLCLSKKRKTHKGWVFKKIIMPDDIV